jgi:hypothetical protein
LGGGGLGTMAEVDRRTAMKGMGVMMAMAATGAAQAQDEDAETVYELRVYHLNESKLPLILDRFRTKETAIFARCGMHGVGYWTPTEEPLEGKTLVYMLRHKSRAAAKESWAKFVADPEWVALKAETEKDGEFVQKIDSTFMKLTDFSPVV